MPRKKPPIPVALTMNQLVAYNLTRARMLRGWSQQRTCDELRTAGLDWSTAVLSAAERSVSPAEGAKPRRFDVDQLLAFAVAFDLPMVFFLLPASSYLDSETDPAERTPWYTLGEGVDSNPVAKDERSIDETTDLVDYYYLGRLVGFEPDLLVRDLLDRFGNVDRSEAESMLSALNGSLLAVLVQSALMSSLDVRLRLAGQAKQLADLAERRQEL